MRTGFQLTGSYLGADIKFRRPSRLDVCVAQNMNVAL